jgi:hypothetical protein
LVLAEKEKGCRAMLRRPSDDYRVDCDDRLKRDIGVFRPRRVTDAVDYLLRRSDNFGLQRHEPVLRFDQPNGQGNRVVEKVH